MKSPFVTASVLLAGVGALPLAGPVAAQASPAAQPPADQASAAAPAPAPAAAGAIEEVVVTGTRIVRDGYTAPTPVTVAPVEDLIKATPSSIPDGLNKLPQFQLSSSPAKSTHNFANSASNGNVLNLRGVGGTRTLILFDGLRLPATTYLGDVDVDVIPSALISRVDVVTAGASAAYGSDAVAGVVNFVLDRRFTGVSGVAQFGVSERNDNENNKLSVAGGFDVFGGNGHLLLSAERTDNKGMLRSDRGISNRGYQYVGKYAGSTAAPGSAANPYVIRENVRQNTASVGGRITGGALAGYRFLPDGSLTPYVAGAPTGSAAYEIGGDGYTIPADVSAIAPLETNKLFARLSYDLGANVTGYAQASFSRNELSYSSMANAFVPPTLARISLDNPYLNLTPAERALLTGAGETTIPVATYNADSSRPLTDETTDFWMVTAGLEGKLGGNWSWSAAYTHGDSRHAVDQSNLYGWRNAYAAIDAVLDVNGDIVCRASLHADPDVASRFADCRPLNILGYGATGQTPEGYDYATGTSRYRAGIQQDTVAASIQGSLFELPAGPVDAAFGAEFRRQELDLSSNADPATLSTQAQRDAYFEGVDNVPPQAMHYWLTNVGSARGSVDVKEAFAEISLPVLSDVTLARALDVNGAVRVTHYSTSGTVETWKLGSTWRPVDDLLLRVTRSRDIRAPTLFNLYAGDQATIGTIADPVSGKIGNVPTVSGGNPALKPEEADTFAIGTVISPSFLPGFSLSVDYFRLKIDGAIGTLASAQIVQNCHASGGSAPECAWIVQPDPNELPTSIRSQPANIAVLETSGADLDTSYTTDLGGGRLHARLYASYLDSYKSQQSALSPMYEYAGRGNSANQPVARPKWRGTLSLNYEVGNFGVFLSEQYVGGWKMGSEEPNQIYENPDIGAVWYTDLTGTYRLRAFDSDVELFATVNNLFDKDPPLVPGNIPGLNLPTIISVYDTVGRAYTAGIRFRF